MKLIPKALLVTYSSWQDFICEAAISPAFYAVMLTIVKTSCSVFSGMSNLYRRYSVIQYIIPVFMKTIKHRLMLKKKKFTFIKRSLESFIIAYIYFAFSITGFTFARMTIALSMYGFRFSIISFAFSLYS